MLTSVNNTGTITANAATSKLLFNGTVAQTYSLGGTYSGTFISNFIVDNTNTATGLSLGTAVANTSVGNLTVDASSIFTLAGFNISVKNDIDNNGIINSTTAGSTISMTGTTAQTIESTLGSGVWIAGTSGRLLNLIINNTSGSSPAVTLSVALTIQTQLTLTAGILDGGTNLTLGTSLAAFTLTRTAGSLASAPTFITYSLSNPYHITYNGATAIDSGPELPPTTTPTYGTLTINPASTNLSLQSDVYMGSLSTVANAIITLNTHNLGLGGVATPVANLGKIDGGTAGSGTITLYGTVAQTSVNFAGTYLNGPFNLVVDNSAGVVATFATTAPTFQDLTVNSNANLNFAAIVVTSKGAVSNLGTLNSGTGTLTMAGTVQQTVDGGGFWTTTSNIAGRLYTLIINNTAAVTPTVNINIALAIQNQLTLTAGILDGGTNITLGTSGAAFTLTRTAGSLASAPTFITYSLTNPYHMTYNGGSAINSGNELPPIDTPTYGTFTISTANTNVTLSSDVYVGSLTTSAATDVLTLGGHNLGLGGIATPIANTGKIDGGTAGSGTITLYGTVAQTSVNFAGTYLNGPFNLVVDNSAGALATFATTAPTFQDLTINSNGNINFAALIITSRGNVSNAGTLNSSTGTLTMAGTVVQDISGLGIWMTASGTGRIYNLTINNTSGATPGVTLSTAVAIQNQLTLTAGILDDGGTNLTIGVPLTNVTVARYAGSLSDAPLFNYTSGVYNISYNTAQAYTVLNELPAYTTPTNGTLTVNLSGANVTLDKSAYIGQIAAISGGTFNMGTSGYHFGVIISNSSQYGFRKHIYSKRKFRQYNIIKRNSSARFYYCRDLHSKHNSKSNSK